MSDKKRFLRSCSTVAHLLEAAAAAVDILPPGPERDLLLQRLAPFEAGVAVAFYNRSDMVTSLPDRLTDQIDDAALDAALERLVKDFQHPWDEMSSFLQLPGREYERAQG